jgi:hypothetical protein
MSGPGASELPTTDFVTGTGAVWIAGDRKLSVSSGGREIKMVDPVADPAEKTNLAAKEPQRVEQMRADLDAWRKSVRASYEGKDYVKP